MAIYFENHIHKGVSFRFHLHKHRMKSESKTNLMPFVHQNPDTSNAWNTRALKDSEKSQHIRWPTCFANNAINVLQLERRVPRFNVCYLYFYADCIRSHVIIGSVCVALFASLLLGVVEL